MIRFIIIFIISFAMSVCASNLDNYLQSELKYKKFTFLQEKYTKAFNEKFVSKGVISIRGNGFVIDYVSPLQYSIIYDGSTIKQIYQGSTEILAGDQIMMTALKYFSDVINLRFKNLNDSFLSYEKDSKLILKPKNEIVRQYLKELIINFNKKEIKSITVNFRYGEYVKFIILEKKI